MISEIQIERNNPAQWNVYSWILEQKSPRAEDFDETDSARHSRTGTRSVVA